MVDKVANSEHNMFCMFSTVPGTLLSERFPGFEQCGHARLAEQYPEFGHHVHAQDGTQGAAVGECALDMRARRRW